MRRAARLASSAVVVGAFTRALSNADGLSADKPVPYKLVSKDRKSPDAYVLCFAVPDDQILGEDPMLPTCIKVVHPHGTDKIGKPKLLEKSYSPISNPAKAGEFELLVKEYQPRPGGGVGAHICGLEVGDSMHATLKKKRKMHGDASVANRWQNIGLVGGGTGVAPLIQIARIVLDNPDDRTLVHFLSINRREEDILMRHELDALAAAHPTRFQVAYSLTTPPDGWQGHEGRGSAEMIKGTLPPPAGGDGTTMVLVCGTDGFVETWAGPVGRGPKKADGSKGGKVQGPLLGLLAAAGFVESEVFKY